MKKDLPKSLVNLPGHKTHPHTNVANVGYPKIKNKLKNIFQNNKKETLLWEAQRTVQNGSLVKMSPLKQRFRTVSFPERFRTVQNGSELFAFLRTFYKERFRMVSWHISWGCVFAHVLSISRFLSWKFGRINFQNWFLKTFELLRRRGLQMFANCFKGRQVTNMIYQRKTSPTGRAAERLRKS